MIGMMYILAFGLYLFISIGVVTWVIRYAHSHGKSTKIWGLSAALLMYLLVFWDWIPTIVIHKYYCDTESGFITYKTLDQWKVENSGIAETLVANKGTPFKSVTSNDGHERKHTYFLNSRFNWVVIKQDINNLFPIIRTEEQVLDVKKNEILARYIDFSTGNSVKNTVGPPGPLKFWMTDQHCVGGEVNGSKLYHFFSAAKHIGQGEKK